MPKRRPIKVGKIWHHKKRVSINSRDWNNIYYLDAVVSLIDLQWTCGEVASDGDLFCIGFCSLQYDFGTIFHPSSIEYIRYLHTSANNLKNSLNLPNCPMRLRTEIWFSHLWARKAPSLDDIVVVTYTLYLAKTLDDPSTIPRSRQVQILTLGMSWLLISNTWENPPELPISQTRYLAFWKYLEGSFYMSSIQVKYLFSRSSMTAPGSIGFLSPDSSIYFPVLAFGRICTCGVGSCRT